MMPTTIIKATGRSGIFISWGAEHRAGNGELISRQASIDPPESLNCIRLSCIWKFVWDMVTYSLILLYHEKRVKYAEANRGKKILERYRTGEPSPKSVWQAFIALTKLGCPICKRVETPW
jgi:hypothetical protein